MKMKNLLLVTIATLGLTAASLAQNLPNYVPANGLVGWWPFNGNANDESGNGNNGLVNGAVLTNDRFGNEGKAFSFDGIDDFIDFGTSILSASNYASVSLWFYTTNQNSASKNIFNKRRSTSGDGFGLGMFNSICRAGLDRYPDIIANPSYTPSVVFDTVWTHAVVNWNGAQLSLYFDGIIQASVALPTGPFIGNEPFYFGKGFTIDPDGAGIRAYQGKLDDMGIWNRALTQQEITDLYNGNICYQTITVTDTLLINMGITSFNPVTYNNTIKIFPNPSNDHITIDYGNFTILNGYQIKIINSLSQNVFQTNVTQQIDYLNLSSWGGNGLYFVQIIDQQGNIIDIKKIVLQ
jgi:hypothetical protein